MRAIVILAGGKSLRMGTDKIFLTYRNASFLEQLVRRASDVFDRVLISAGSKEHADLIFRSLASSGISILPEIICDTEPDLGPIGGLMSVFEQTGLERFAVIASDIPNADMQVLEALLERLEQMDADDHRAAVMLMLDAGFPEPCAAAYDKSSYPLMSAAAARGMRSLVRALGPDRIDTVTAQEMKRSSPAFTELDLETAFHNINTPEDYRGLSDR